MEWNSYKESFQIQQANNPLWETGEESLESKDGEVSS